MIHSWRMREPLQSFLDGELPEARQAQVTGHLAQCDQCSTALRLMAENDHLLLATRPVPAALLPTVSQAMLERAMAAAQAGRGGPGRGMTLLAWGFAAVLVVVASGAAAWWRQPGLLVHRHPLIEVGGISRGTWEEAGAASGGRNSLFTGNAAPSPRVQPPKNTTRGVGERHAVKKSGQMSRPPAPTLPHADPILRHHWPSWRRYIAEAPPAREWPADPSRERDARIDQSAPERLASADDTVSSLADDPTGSPPTEVEARECDLAAERLLAAALDGDPAARQRVEEALLTDPSSEGQPDSVAFPDPDIQVADWPLPWEGDDPDAWERLTAASDPQLLVMVATTPAPSAVRVSEAPPETPGYARAIALRPDASGRETWTQATASTEGAGIETALVLLGDNVWQW